MLQGRDIVREAAAGREIDPEMLLRLEHVIVSHQRLPEWGAPKPPMTPEALIVHYADDLDAKMQMIVCTLKEDTSERAGHVEAQSDGPAVLPRRNVAGISHGVTECTEYSTIAERSHSSAATARGACAATLWPARRAAWPARSRIVGPSSNAGVSRMSCSTSAAIIGLTSMKQRAARLQPLRRLLDRAAQ